MSDKIKVRVEYPDGRPTETHEVGPEESLVVVGLNRAIRAHQRDEERDEIFVAIGPSDVKPLQRAPMTFGEMEEAGKTFDQVQGP